MANTLNGVSPDRLAQQLKDSIAAQIESLIAEGHTRGEAEKIVNEALNRWAWNMATNPSPLGG